MRLVVVVEWGPRRWQKALIHPGQSLRVGRLERADLVIPHDEKMSGLHFELAWDGARCTVRDLGSQSGTLIDGEQASTGTLGHGGWVQAGQTVFSAYVEGKIPPLAASGLRPPAGDDDDEAPEIVPVAASRKASVLALLRAEPAPLFAVLDAARNPRILKLLRVAPDEVRSLYDGDQGEALDEVAPHVVALDKGGWLLERLVDEGWGQGWGIYLLCSRPLSEVRRQLRRMLIVEEQETEDTLYFRFYDPIVLAKALSVCNPRQRQQMFGDVDAFLIEGDDAALFRHLPVEARPA